MKTSRKLNFKITKKLTLAIGAVIFLLMAATTTTLYLHLHAKSAPVAQAPISREQAIPKAQEYLLRNLDDVDPTLRLMLDFLYRKFSIDNKFSGQVNHIDTSANDPLVQDELKAIERIAYKDTLVKDLGSNPSLIAQAANCDKIRLPSNISSVLQQEIDKGGVELTHAFLSMQFMKELDCTVSNADSLRQQMVDGMINIARNGKDDKDIRYECIAFLLYAGKYEAIDPSWIDQIYTEQSQDGGWKVSQNDATTNNHPTVLALWALLEYTRSDVPYEPIIHLPKKQV
jgi:hypothetical protein